MSWQYVPSLFRTPEVPGLTPPDGIWRGKGGDEGRYSFYSSNWGGYIIVEDGKFAHSLRIGSSILTPVFSDVNGYIYWQGDGYVYFSKTFGWIWAFEFPGYEPIENVTFEDGKIVWKGDRFYKMYSPPYSPDREETLSPRGSLGEEGEERKATAVWPRWVAKSGEFGVYEGTDGASGERVKGLPRFRGNGEWFVRSLNKEKGYFSYGRIRHVGDKWLIGEEGSDAGWHEGEEPKAGGTVTFRFTKPKGSEAVGKDIAVAFYDYVAGEETDTAYLGSVAIWR